MRILMVGSKSRPDQKGIETVVSDGAIPLPHPRADPIKKGLRRAEYLDHHKPKIQEQTRSKRD